MSHATDYYNMRPMADVSFWARDPEQSWTVYCHPFLGGAYVGGCSPLSRPVYSHGAQHCFSTVVDIRGWWLYRTNDPQVKGLLGVSEAA